MLCDWKNFADLIRFRLSTAQCGQQAMPTPVLSAASPTHCKLIERAWKQAGDLNIGNFRLKLITFPLDCTTKKTLVQAFQARKQTPSCVEKVVTSAIHMPTPAAELQFLREMPCLGFFHCNFANECQEGFTTISFCCFLSLQTAPMSELKMFCQMPATLHSMATFPPDFTPAPQEHFPETTSTASKRRHNGSPTTDNGTSNPGPPTGPSSLSRAERNTPSLPHFAASFCFPQDTPKWTSQKEQLRHPVPDHSHTIQEPGLCVAFMDILENNVCLHETPTKLEDQWKSHLHGQDSSQPWDPLPAHSLLVLGNHPHTTKGHRQK